METYGIESLGIKNPKEVLRNLSPAVLTETALKTEESMLMDKGALLINTGKYTGRSPDDKFIVKDDVTENTVNWGKVNVPIAYENYKKIYDRVMKFFEKRTVYVFDGFAGADPEYRLSVRVVNELASQNLFMNNMLIRPTADELKGFKSDFTVICAPGVKCDPKKDGVNSEAAIIVNFKEKVVLIAGSKYCGEMKKSVFSVMNYILTDKHVLPMHCSANMSLDGSQKTALFFGLSGTGKTTLSADPNRGLIGDDEHGWSDKGIFNFEGGCYAKCIDLTEEREPDIYRAIRHGAVVENVVVDKDMHAPNYEDKSITENTRVSYPLHFIDNAVVPSVGGHPTTVIFLTADAFGVLPPVAKLTREQAKYYFISGYTSKLAGTERGITEPQTTFSTCFGAPFLPRPTNIYAQLLGEKLEKFGSDVYLINTGWTGGKYGVGKRMSLKETRAIVTAALNGELAKVAYDVEPYFGLSIPKTCPGCDSKVLNPINTWSDKNEYEATAKHLAASFVENFKKYKDMPESIVNAGPNA